MNKLILAAFFLLFSNFGFCAEKYKVEGQVVDSLTKEPIEGAVIQVKEENLSAVSDGKGSFSLETERDKISIISGIGGYKNYQKLLLLPCPPLVIELELAAEYTFGKIYVKDKFRNEGSKQKVQSEQIKKTTTSIFSDSLKVIQTLPGVVTGDDFSSLMYVRGGEFYETASFIDNIAIRDPYIWGGALSVFNPSFIDKIDFYSGGYPARYPQALSSVLDVKNLEGDYAQRKGFVELSLTTFEFFTEGPIVKEKSSYLFGIRRTYYDLAMNLIYRDKYKNIAFPYFYDAQSKFVWKLTDKDKLSLNTIISYEGMDLKMSDLGQDNMGEDKEIEVHYKEFQILPAINWERIQNDRLSFNFTLSSLSNHGNYNFSTSEVSAQSKELSNDFYFRNKVVFLADNHTIEQGLYFSRTWLYVDTRDKNRVLMPNGIYYEDEKNIKFDWTRLGTGGIYLQDDWELIKDKLFFNFGGLYEYFDYTKDTTFCPRGGIKYSLTETTTLKFNTGLYSQFPVNEKYEAKDGEPPFFRNKNIKSEKAVHYIVGLEQELAKHFFFRLETYLKNYYHRIVQDPDPDLVFANNGIRRAWGVDVFLQRKISEKWDGWLAYSYLSAKDKILKRNNPSNYSGQSELDYLSPINEWFTIDKERKHNFSLVFNYEINSRYKLAVTSRFSTGMPYTEVTGATAYGKVYVPSYGNYLGSRLPNYERIDVKLSMPFFRVKNTECFLQIINLLNSTNVNGYYYSDDYAQKESEKMLPFIPIFGVKYIF